MLCLETWYFMALVLFAGYMKNAEAAVDALCIWFTVNLRRRIMQHNGKICGGACRTKFELAWQYPRKVWGIKKWAVRFKYLDGLAAKIKLAYKLLTLSPWNGLILTVNFFSTKYTKYYAGCPSLPSHMRVYVRSMDELPCYTEGYKEVEYGIGNCSWDDDEEPDHRDVGSEATCVLDIEDHEQPSCSNDSRGWLFSRTLERSPATMEDENAKMDDGMGSCSRVTIDVDGPGTKIEVIDLLTPSRESRTKSRISASSGEVEVIDPFTPPESRTKSHISASSVVEEVEVMDLLTPSPELRTKSPRTKNKIPFICPEIVDLTHSY